MDEMIICVAPYPGEKQEERFPGKMDVAQEVIRCHNAGASIAHLHVRDKNGLQTTDTRWFRADIEEIRATCPMIIEASTGGAPEHTLAERCVAFTAPGVEMGSLNMGSINMFGDVYKNPLPDVRFYAKELKQRHLKPFLICFDLSHFSGLVKLEQEQLVSAPYVSSLVFDIPDALPYRDHYLDIFLKELPANCVWFLARHHARGAPGFIKALEMGGHVRVGYEDGPFLSTGDRARSNAELVEDIVRTAERVGRKVVGPDRAREIIGLEKFAV